MDKIPDKEIARFFAKVQKTDNCWLWSGTKDSRGYGNFHSTSLGVIKHGNIPSHRWSYIFHNGAIPEGKIICHKCNNASCVNPSHLYAGTHVDNNRDTVRSGNHLNGSMKKTHCKHGHEFYGKNLIITSRGYRRCRACKNRNHLRAYHLKKGPKAI